MSNNKTPPTSSSSIAAAVAAAAAALLEEAATPAAGTIGSPNMSTSNHILEKKVCISQDIDIGIGMKNSDEENN